MGLIPASVSTGRRRSRTGHGFHGERAMGGMTTHEDVQNVVDYFVDRRNQQKREEQFYDNAAKEFGGYDKNDAFTFDNRNMDSMMNNFGKKY